MCICHQSVHNGIGKCWFSYIIIPFSNRELRSHNDSFTLITVFKNLKQRQSIVEHPFGTIKRQWGFYFILSKKGLARASADVGLMVTAYNLRRLMNILCIDVFREAIIASTLQLSLLLWLIRAKPSGVSLCRPSWAFLLKTVNTFFFHLYLGNDCRLNGGCETNCRWSSCLTAPLPEK